MRTSAFLVMSWNASIGEPGAVHLQGLRSIFVGEGDRLGGGDLAACARWVGSTASVDRSVSAIVVALMTNDPDLHPSQEDEQPVASRRQRMRLIAGAILGALGLAFALVNLSSVKVDWIVGSAHSPLILVILVSVLIGVGIDRVALMRARKRSKSP